MTLPRRGWPRRNPHRISVVRVCVLIRLPGLSAAHVSHSTRDCVSCGSRLHLPAATPLNVWRGTRGGGELGSFHVHVS